mmetsp:Transcript_11521/g.28232  ORF Transcript_11521/g.28232 Transcript_11521/m.28232 type:complete len:157 (+) Transcript_11521:127-597(+)
MTSTWITPGASSSSIGGFLTSIQAFSANWRHTRSNLAASRASRGGDTPRTHAHALVGHEQGVRHEEYHGVSELALAEIKACAVNEEESCSICLEHFATHNSDGAAIPPYGRLHACELPRCSHKFHRDCIVPWLKKQKTCPVCRVEVQESGEQGERG